MNDDCRWDVLNPMSEEIENLESYFRSLSRRYDDLFDYEQVAECQHFFSEVNKTLRRLWIVAGGVL